MENPSLPSNSEKSKERVKKPITEKTPMLPVVTGPVIQKKASLGSRFKGVFFGSDGRSVASYVFGGVLLPAAKNAVVDAVTRGIERAIYGDASPRRSPSAPSGIYGQTQYNRPIYRPDSRQQGVMLPGQPPHVIPRANGDLNFVLQSREEGDQVIDTMIEAVSMYGFVTVADLYQLLGLPFNHQDLKWGWTTPPMATLRQVRDGYHLVMPPAEAID